MSENQPPNPSDEGWGQAPPPPPGQGWGQAPPPPPGAAPPGYGAAPPMNAGQAMYGGGGGQIGKVRGTGLSIVLFLITCGIYGIYYYFVTHEEMKQHSNQGVGGLVALLLAIFVGIVNPFLLSAEVGNLRAGRGQEQRVSGMTGLWYFPGMFILVGPFIWFVKTNDALNEYWISQGAQPA